MIEVLTIIITTQGVTLQAVGDKGVLREEYLPDANGVLGITEGNFCDEQEFGDNDDLVSALCDLVEPAKAAWQALTKK